jgi:hypothetical protein
LLIGGRCYNKERLSQWVPDMPDDDRTEFEQSAQPPAAFPFLPEERRKEQDRRQADRQGKYDRRRNRCVHCVHFTEEGEARGNAITITPRWWRMRLPVRFLSRASHRRGSKPGGTKLRGAVSIVGFPAWEFKAAIRRGL